MSRVFIQHKIAYWLILVSVLTLLGTASLAFAQGGAASSGETDLGAKVTAGSATLTAAPSSRANDRSLRPLKTDAGVATLADSNPAIKGQVLTGVKQALRAAGVTGKGKYARVSSAQRQQLASLSASRKADAAFGVRFNRVAGTPAMIKLSTPKASTGLRAGSLSDGASAARSFLRQNRVLLGMTDPDTEMDLARQWQGPLGSRHFRYQQQVAGIPVWGREALVHVDGSNAVYLYQGHTVKSAAQATANTARIDAAEALFAAQAHLGETAVASADNPDRLVYYPQGGDDLVLCYQIGVERDLADRWWYFIDAGSGEVVHRISRVADAVVSASGSSLLGVTRSFNAWSEGSTYFLVDPTIPDSAYDDPVANLSSKGNLYVLDARNGEGDNLYYITSTSTTSGWDAAGVSVIYNIGQVYDYYQDTHGRDGIDNADMNYQAVVHLGQNYANAFWNGTFIVFGDGDNQTFSNLAASLDITAHEIQHGVTEFTAGLIYENQSGALNEAYSDIFACMVDRDDWTVGEDVTLVSPGFLRDLAHPENGLTPLPTKMSEYRNMPVDEDHGGVHINMSIPSRAAYLIAEGLTTEGLGTAIGRDKTELIFYRALTTYLTASSNFNDGRSATLQAAEDLYGAGSAEVTAVGAGWDGVEVFADGGGAPDDPNPTPGDPVSGSDLMVYLYPQDGTHNSASEDFDLYVQSLPSPFSGYDANLDDGPLNAVPAFYNKPAAYSVGDATLVLYVGSDNDLYGVYADGSNHTQISNRGDIYSIALSPDGGYFAYTTTSAADNNIYVGELESGETTIYELVSPTTEHPGDSSELNTIFYADSLAFDYTSSLIVFDALNCVSTADSNCSDTNGGYRYWSIGIIDLNDGSVFYPFPNQNPDFDLAYPAFAANNSYILALDEIDHTEESTSGTIGTTVWTYNWNDGTSHAIIDPNIGSSNRIVYGVPSFWGDDDYLTVQRLSDTNGAAYRVPIDSDWNLGTGGLLQINDYAVAMPVMHRTGTRSTDTDLALSSTSLSFGSVDPGSSSSLGVTLTNNGERDIEITGISSSSTYFTHNGINTRLPRGSDMTITITYQAPTSEGSQSGTLTITSNADTPTRTISLSGQSGSGGDGGGGGSSGGGCFVKSLLMTR